MLIVKSDKILSSIAKVLKLPNFFNPQVCTTRANSGRTSCSKTEGPRCSESNLKQTGCYEKTKKGKKKEDESPFKSMWFNPACCMEVCKDVLPRFDELYYKISDKAKREYPQTWVECPERKIVPKVMCSFDKLIYPPMKKRAKKPTSKVAKCPQGKDDNKLACYLEKNKNCMKQLSPGCRPARDPPTCSIGRKVKKCKKVCTPYPSFSECSKPGVKKLREVECYCLGTVPNCELFAYLKQRGQLSKLKN